MIRNLPKKYRSIKQIDFYRAIVEKANPEMPSELVTDALLFMYDLGEKPMKSQTRILGRHSMVTELLILYHISSKLIGSELAKVIVYLANLCRDLEGKVVGLPSKQDLQARLIDLLMSKEYGNKQLYNTAISCRDRLESMVEKGMDAEEQARQILSRIGRDNIAGYLIRKARRSGDVALFDIVPNIITFYFNRSGPYANELGARELVNILKVTLGLNEEQPVLET